MAMIGVAISNPVYLPVTADVMYEIAHTPKIVITIKDRMHPSHRTDRRASSPQTRL